MFFCLKNLRWALFCSYVLLSNLTAAAQDFIAMEIPDSVWLRMQGKAYADRSRAFRYKIKAGDLCHRLFLKHGFSWGGSWRTLKDYQHFEFRM